MSRSNPKLTVVETPVDAPTDVPPILPVLHLKTEIYVEFATVVDENVLSFDPIRFDLTQVNEATLSEFWGLFEEKRQTLFAQLNGTLSLSPPVE